MENEEFLRLCKAKVAEYTNAHMDNTDRQQIHVNDVYLVQELQGITEQQSTAQHYSSGWQCTTN